MQIKPPANAGAISAYQIALEEVRRGLRPADNSIFDLMRAAREADVTNPKANIAPERIFQQSAQGRVTVNMPENASVTISRTANEVGMPDDESHYTVRIAPKNLNPQDRNKGEGADFRPVTAVMSEKELSQAGFNAYKSGRNDIAFTGGKAPQGLALHVSSAGAEVHNGHTVDAIVNGKLQHTPEPVHKPAVARAQPYYVPRPQIVHAPEPDSKYKGFRLAATGPTGPTAFRRSDQANDGSYYFQGGFRNGYGGRSFGGHHDLARGLTNPRVRKALDALQNANPDDIIRVPTLPYAGGTPGGRGR